MRTQRLEKHMYQIDYISVEMCSQKTKLEKIPLQKTVWPYNWVLEKM